MHEVKLTEFELIIIKHLGDAIGEYLLLTPYFDNMAEEFMAAVHAAQGIVYGRVVMRMHPELFGEKDFLGGE